MDEQQFNQLDLNQDGKLDYAEAQMMFIIIIEGQILKELLLFFNKSISELIRYCANNIDTYRISKLFIYLTF